MWVLFFVHSPLAQVTNTLVAITALSLFPRKVTAGVALLFFFFPLG